MTGKQKKASIPEKIILPAMLIAGAVLLAQYAFFDSIWNDETVYMWLVSRVLKNPLFLFSREVSLNSFSHSFVAVSSIFSLFFDVFTASRLAAVFTSVAGIFLIFRIAHRHLGFNSAVVASILLAVTPLYFFLSTRALTDVPLAVAVLFSLNFLMDFDPEKKKTGTLAGLSLLLPLFTKFSGLLILPAAFLYILIRNKGLKPRPGTVSFIVAASVSVGLYLANNLILFGSFLPLSPERLAGGYIFTGTPLYYIQNIGFMYSSVLFLLACLGMYFGFAENSRMTAVSLIFGIYFLFFSFVIGEKEPRYIAMTIPLVVLSATYAVKKLAEKIKLPAYSVFVLLIFVFSFYPKAVELTTSKKYTYTGFQELGQLAGEFDSQANFSKIYATSTRQIRAFSGIEYAEDGGKINGLPASMGELSDETNILLQIDIWEYTAPEWAYPLSQEKLNAMLAQNFTLVHVAERDYPTESGIQKIPVGLLLAK